MTKQIIVVKLGGTEGLDFQAICEDVASFKNSNPDRALVLVHGGSAEANALGETLNQPPRFVISPSGYSSRYTDRPTLEVFTMAVNGKVNTLLVEQLQKLGVNALGLSGLDGRLLRARRKSAIRVVENGKQKVPEQINGRYVYECREKTSRICTRFGRMPAALLGVCRCSSLLDAISDSVVHLVRKRERNRDQQHDKCEKTKS